MMKLNIYNQSSESATCYQHLCVITVVPFLRWGAPKRLLSDQGREFVSHVSLLIKKKNIENNASAFECALDFHRSYNIILCIVESVHDHNTWHTCMAFMYIYIYIIH